MKHPMLSMVLVSGLLLAHTVARADFDAGEKAYVAENYAVALKEFQPLAAKGNPQASYYLAAMYEQGLGVPEDRQKAMMLYRKAADGGVVPALSQLASLYYRGTAGSTQEAVDKAFALWKEAAAKGDGEGIEMSAKHPSIADQPYLHYKYLWMAVYRGNDDAKGGLEFIKGLSAAQKAKAEAEAKVWAQSDPLPPLPTK